MGDSEHNGRLDSQELHLYFGGCRYTTAEQMNSNPQHLHLVLQEHPHVDSLHAAVSQLDTSLDILNAFAIYIPNVRWALWNWCGMHPEIRGVEVEQGWTCSRLHTGLINEEFGARIVAARVLHSIILNKSSVAEYFQSCVRS